MKRIISILVMCAMLTACGNSYEYENAELPTVSPTEVASETTDKTESAEEKSEDIGEISYEVTEEISSDMTSPTSQTAEIAAGSSDEPIAEETQETEAVSDNTKEEKEPVFSEESAESRTTAQHTTTPYTTEKAVTTATSAAPEKPKSVQTTAPPVTTVIVTTPVTEPINEPPAQPETKPKIVLENDGTDHGKARAVYEYMRENGSGTCVNYACQTYEMCREVGLPCYIVWTNAGMYGHVANTVCVNGTWFILDTQGGYFLECNYGFTEVVDIDGNHVADGDILSNYSYDELN